MSIVVVGLGPGPASWVTDAASRAMRDPQATVFARTSHHPAVAALMAERTVESFDPLYDRAESLEDVRNAIVDRLLRAAEQGIVVYAVPGDGSIGEAVVRELRSHAADLTVIPGVSDAAAALAAAGLSPIEGVQSVDALSLGGTGINLGVEPNPRWPVVVTGVYGRGVASEVKLALSRVYPDEHTVTVATHVGQADELAVSVPLVEMDRGGSVSFDHLTHLVLGPVPTEIPTGSTHGLRAIVARLRAPEIGCPWDLEQTHESLIPYAIEEAYEVVDAIREGSPSELLEELGDLLLQVFLHAELADQEGDFDLNDVVRGISAKLIRRHPHVFGEWTVSGSSEVLVNWDKLKAAEKAGQPEPESAMDKVSKHEPALRMAREMGRRAVKAGFEWPDRAGAIAKIREEVDELLAARSDEERFDELGDVLWMLAYLADAEGLDAEEALRASSQEFARRFRVLERLARERGWESLKGREPSELQALWEQAKREVASPA